MELETIADFKVSISDELALFDTLKVILEFVDKQAEHIETVVTSKLQEELFWFLYRIQKGIHAGMVYVGFSAISPRVARKIKKL